MVRRNRSTEIGAGRDTARFAWLLAALVVALALPAFLHQARLGVGSLRIGLAAVLVASLAPIARERRMLWLGLALVAPALLLDWASLFFHSHALAVGSAMAAMGFLGVVVFTIAGNLLTTDRVTTDTILGGICVYLLIGLLWVSAFTLLEILQPGSIQLDGAPLREIPSEPFRYTEILYFSFVTLTTLGYGDMAPVTPAARAVAGAEALVGQLYVAIFVARLVGLHLVETRRES